MHPDPAPRLILASASPRRRELLAEAGYVFVVEPPSVNEEAFTRSGPPHGLAEALAQLKADTIAQSHREELVVILAADTIVVSSSGEILGKAADRIDAARILRTLAGTRHQVITGYCCIRCDDGRRVSDSASSEVLMRPLSAAEIEAHLDSRKWEGKAGAYGVQDDPGRMMGTGDPFIESISGELTNVVGLPMPQVIDALDKLGVARRP